MFNLYLYEGKRRKSWILDIKLPGQKRTRPVIGHNPPMSRREAEAIKAKRELEYFLNKEGLKKFKKIKTKELFELFIKLKQKQIRAPSLKKYYGHLEYWSRKHKEDFMPLSILEIEDCLFELSESKLSNATVNSYLLTLKQLYNYAEKRDLLKKNTAKEIKQLKKKPRNPPRYFTDKEIEKILSYDTPYRDIFIILLYTGMRKSALRFLEWEDINFENKTIYIHNKKGFTTKSGKNRIIPMHPKVEEILWRRQQNSGYIFHYSTGNPHHRNKWNDSLKKILKKENIQNASLHTFRHTFATRFLFSGGSMKELQEILGHASIETTQIYAHLVPEHLQKSIERLK